MSKIYDVIVVGASHDGIEAYLTLKKNKQLAIAVVSTDFTNSTTGHAVFNADRINNKVVFVKYYQRLVILTLEDNSLLCCKYVIFATGSSSVKLSLPTKDIYYRAHDFKSKAVAAPIAIVGNNQTAVDTALLLADKFKYIYFCNSDLSLHCNNNDALKIHNTRNIAYLPNCKIVNCINDNNGKLKEIILDTYEKLSCRAILYFGQQIPNTDYITPQLLKVSADKHVKVDDTFQALNFPEIYAVGSCSNKVGGGQIAAAHILKHLED